MLRRPFLRLSAAPASSRMQMIKELRARTDAPLSDCGKAVDAANGSVDEAISWLQKNGATKALKKQGRETQYGVVCACIVPGKAAAILQVCSETDFAARNDRFLGCAEEVRLEVQRVLDATSKLGGDLPTDDALLEEISNRVKPTLASCISVVGENVTVRKVLQLPLKVGEENYSKDANLYVGHYVHNAAKNYGLVGSIVGVTALTPIAEPRDFAETLANEMAQHQVAHYGDASQLQPQAFLGGEETAGQWMKRVGFRVRSCLLYKSGDLEPVLKVPVYGKPQTP